MTDHLTIEDQMKRCRRIAGYLTDPELRQSLEALAEEYESRLPKRSRSFMLRDSDRDSHPA
jgi:hypothetical protein